MATIQWISSANGNWNQASNWQGGVIPGPNDDVIINLASANPVITIPTNVTVKSIVSQEKIVANGSLTLTAGTSTINGDLTASPGTSLTVENAGTSLVANGVTVVNKANLYAENGGLLSLPKVTSYTGAEYQTYIQAEGSGSKIELPALNTLTGSLYDQVYARAYSGGLVNLGVTSITKGVEFVADGLNSTVKADKLASNTGKFDLFAQNQGTLKLPALTSYTGAEYQTYIQAEGSGSKIELPALNTLTGSLYDQVYARAYSGGLVNLGVTSITKGVEFVADGLNSTVKADKLASNTGKFDLFAQNQGTLKLPALTSYTGAEYQTYIQAEGSGSKIELPALNTLTGSLYDQVYARAYSGGLVDLGVTSISKGVDFRADGVNSTVNLKKLRTANGEIIAAATNKGIVDVRNLTNIPSGQFTFSADGSGSIVKTTSLPITGSTSTSETNGGDVQPVPPSANSDYIIGTQGNDTINALDGNDLLIGWEGNDNLSGGNGNDDLSGENGDDTLNGGSGVDTLKGGTGNDIYVVDNTADVVTELASAGTDLIQSSVTYTLPVNVENLTLTGTAAINGTGNTLANIIRGNTANNILTGGAGNDTYVVNNTGDIVTELASAGTDLIQSSVTYTLPANVENLTLTGTAAINGTGNTLANIITGNTANNILNGSSGADQLKGGAGNDTYVVDNVGDIVTELASAGTDLIQSSVTYTLPANVENLTLTGTAAINGTGNTLANIITGNTANNILNGSSGADQLKGGAGNDTYVVDNVGDIVTELASAGTDLIQSSVTYTLPANVENLTLTGTTAINGTGNALVNIITGNTANNILNGGDGNDIIQGNAGVDQLLGGNGNDSLNGRAGNDVLTGGLGADKFIYNTNAAFTTTEVGVDTITDFNISQTDQIVLDKTTFTSISSIAGTGFSVVSEFAKVTTDALAATSAADIVYNTATGGLFYNQNGTATGFGTGGQFITLTNKPVLTASQFLIQA